MEPNLSRMGFREL